MNVDEDKLKAQHGELGGSFAEVDLSVENAGYDGRFEESHFTDIEYNRICAEAVRDAMLGFFTQHRDQRNKRHFNVIDAGAGAADFLAAVKDMLDSEETELYLQRNGIKKHQIRLIAIDVDPKKVAEGKSRRALKETKGMQIDYREADILSLHEIDEIDRTNPTFIIQRSVTQYFTDPGFDPKDPDTWPNAERGGFTDAQVSLMNYYAHNLHTNGTNPGSELAIIESTGDARYARQFSFILAEITKRDGADYKKDWFLTDEEFGALIETVNKMNKGKKTVNGSGKLPAVLNHITSETIAAGYGERRVADLYRRYGNGYTLDEFRVKVLDAYEMARQITGGETDQITREGDDLLIQPQYRLHLIGLNGRAKR